MAHGAAARARLAAGLALSDPSGLPAPLGPLDWPLAGEAFARDPPRVEGPLPRLTVVTPSFNQGQYLEATLRSVLGQGYPNLEYLVIDGGSKDRSVDIIKHYSGALAYWVSEPDRGQPHAIQKGLELATGDWFVWINSDDLLAPGALWAVAAAHGACDVIAGATRHFDAAGLGKTYRPRHIDADRLIREQLHSGIRWQQPSTWLRREPLRKVGLDLGLQYAFDYEVLIRYLARHPRVRYLRRTLAYFRFHPASKTMSQGDRFRLEQVQAFRALCARPELQPWHAALDLAGRGVEWLRTVDGLLADRGRSRWRRLRELWAGARADPPARCTKNTRRAGRRILLKGGRDVR